MKVLILGATGQLGRALWESRPPGVDCLSYGRDQLDLCRQETIEPSVCTVHPGIVINAAAYTAVDRAETEPDIARRVNAEAPAELARLARRDAFRLVQVSTDFVCPGDRGRPWRPDDPTDPVNRYGASKAEGESRIRVLLPERSLIVRTGWVYAPWGHNFFLTVLRLLGEREELRVIDDQIGTPTSALSLARFLWEVSTRTELTGVLHWSDAGVASWYDFACAIQEEALSQGLLARRIPIHPIPTEAYPLPARRPAQSLLDKSGTIQQVGFEPSHWRVALGEVVQRLVDTPDHRPAAIHPRD